jgi:hypothetical protein
MKNFKAKPGDILQITEGPNPHKGNAKETVTITVLCLDYMQDGGFYYFHGKGYPSRKRIRVEHSNMFVWGAENVQKIGEVEMPTVTYKEHSWILSGIPSIDLQIANLGNHYRVFCKLAPAWALKLYKEQENDNFHDENREMVLNFLNWLEAGRPPKEFAPHE